MKTRTFLIILDILVLLYFGLLVGVLAWVILTGAGVL